jgi:hypothetical protein
VGPVAGKAAPKLAEATPKVSAAVKTSFRIVIFKFISIYGCGFRKNPWRLASKILSQRLKERRFINRRFWSATEVAVPSEGRGARVLRRPRAEVNRRSANFSAGAR